MDEMAERAAIIKIARDVDKGKLCLYSRIDIQEKLVRMLRFEALEAKVSFASNTENNKVICCLYLYSISRVCIRLLLD
jgi:hypothetical protein